jgi:hypothetical protein
MIDIDTFLTTLYVMVDDFCKSHPARKRPGPEASLSRSEVLTLALFSQWSRFASQQDFYRYADRHLRAAFPCLPNRSQFNRLLRHAHADLVAFFGFLAELQRPALGTCEILDSAGIAVRNPKRRGAGWLPGTADIGWCTRLGWYEGVHLLTAVQPDGVITGFGFGPATARDQRLAETFLALRAQAPTLLPSVGTPARGPYLADKGFQGMGGHGRWCLPAGVELICPPQRKSCHPWPKKLRRWFAGLRQMVETVHEKLFNAFRLERERPHTLDGLHAILAAKAALHNFCIWLNGQLGRPPLAFADLIDW